MDVWVGKMEAFYNREVRMGTEEWVLEIIYGVAEWIKMSTPRWYGHIQEVKEESLLKKMFWSEL